jgi:hypothetical protein
LNDQDLHARMTSVVADPPPFGLDVDSVISDGRRIRRRRRMRNGILSAGVAAGVVALLAATLPGWVRGGGNETVATVVPSSSAVGGAALADDPLAGRPLDKAGPEQSAEIADREASFEEYDAAFTRLRECLRDRGHEMSGVKLGDNRLYEWGVAGDASDDVLDCENKHYRFTAILWMSQVLPDVPKDSGDPLDGADLSTVSPAQAAEIADRVVTEAEYDAAFQRYGKCLRAEGFKLRTVRKTSDGVYDFAIPDAAVTSGAEDRCGSKEYYLVDMLWQLAKEAENGNPEMERLRACLREWGITPSEDDDEIIPQMRDVDKTPMDCMP